MTYMGLWPSHLYMCTHPNTTAHTRRYMASPYKKKSFREGICEGNMKLPNSMFLRIIATVILRKR